MLVFLTAFGKSLIIFSSILNTKKIFTSLSTNSKLTFTNTHFIMVKIWFHQLQVQLSSEIVKNANFVNV